MFSLFIRDEEDAEACSRQCSKDLGRTGKAELWTGNQEKENWQLEQGTEQTWDSNRAWKAKTWWREEKGNLSFLVTTQSSRFVTIIDQLIVCL